MRQHPVSACNLDPPTAGPPADFHLLSIRLHKHRPVVRGVEHWDPAPLETFDYCLRGVPEAVVFSGTEDHRLRRGGFHELLRTRCGTSVVRRFEDADARG